MPKCLYSIAFGITGVQTNPDFPKMLEYCYENDVIPNYTLSGADLNDEILEVTSKYCGAVAVSCYEGHHEKMDRSPSGLESHLCSARDLLW